MFKYIMKRIGYMFLTLLILSTIVFLLVNLIPGDPIGTRAKVMPPEVQARIRARYGLDKPLYVQYGLYMKNLLKGDLGMSTFYSGKSVNSMISAEFPASARLGVQAVLFGLIIGLTLGVIAAFCRGRWPDYVVMFIAIAGISIPGFVLALLFQKYFGGKFGIPIVGWPRSKSWLTGFKFTLLPTLALSLGGLASNARYMRTSVLDVINQDYVLTAKSKGVTNFALIWKHILRNALLPVVTLVGPRLASVITGSIVIEQIFAVPGIGRELVSAIGNRDYTVVMSLTIFFAALYIVSLLFVDITYVLVDPRIKLDSKSR